MKVLMVLGRSTGGIGAHVDRLTRDLRKLGHEVVIVTAPSTAAEFGWSDARLLWPVRRGMAAPRGAVDWHLVKNLAGTVDVVHAHGHQAAFVAAVAVARATPHPALVVSLHNELPPALDGPAAGSAGGLAKLRQVVTGAAHRAVAWSLRRAALVTGASDDLVELARRLGGVRVELASVASPAVAGLLADDSPGDEQRTENRASLFEASRALTGADPALPLVLTVARIAPQKDLPTLLAAARELTSPATWVVVGGGDDALRASLESQLSGIRLHLAGPQRDVQAWLRAADVFVLTSRWEARALVVQEAMAAGLPVVATRTGGLPDLVNDAGILVPVGDPHAVASAVDRLLSDGTLRRELGGAARARATAWADPAEEARRWVSRYTAAVAG
jgi:glycosyltransferase involved in cell wall biosynthesis